MRWAKQFHIGGGYTDTAWIILTQGCSLKVMESGSPSLQAPRPGRCCGEATSAPATPPDERVVLKRCSFPLTARLD